MQNINQLPIDFASLVPFMETLAEAQKAFKDQHFYVDNYETRAIRVQDSLLQMHLFQVCFDPSEFSDYYDILDMFRGQFFDDILDGKLTMDYHYMGPGHISVCLINHKSL